MDSQIIIPELLSLYQYELFYGLAFLVSLLIVVYQGYRMKLHRYKWLQLLLVVVAVRIFFIAGTKLVTLTGDEWSYAFNNFCFPLTTAKASWGGFLLALIGFGLAKVWLRYQFKLFDAYAMAIPAGMAVQRAGCLFAGCCHGEVTTLPWSIQYGHFSSAFYHQVQSGMIDESATYSLGVHPVPLYIMMYCLLTILLVWRFKKYFQSSGNQTLFSVTLLFIGRFFVEFFRDPSTNHLMGNTHLGIKQIQWVLLIMISILVLVIVVKEYVFKKRIATKTDLSLNYPVSISFVIFLSLLLFLGRNWFTRIEMLSLLMLVISIAAFLFWQLFLQLSSPASRFVFISLASLSLILMSQTVLETERMDSTEVSERKSWHSIGASYGIGNYSKVDYNCDGDVIEKHQFNYHINKIEYNWYVSFNEYQRSNVGIRGYTGKINSEDNISQSFYAISPYLKYDFKRLGLAAGFHKGELYYNGIKENLLPMGYLRIGNWKKVYLEASIYDNSYYYMPVSSFRTGVGINLGNDLSSCHIGLTDIEGQNSIYLAGQFLIAKQLLIEPNTSLQLGDGKGIHGGIGIHYLFGNIPED